MKAMVIVAVVLTIAAVLFAIFAPRSDWYDPSALSGGYDEMTAEEIQADLDERVAEGSMNVSIASNIRFAEGSTSAQARIENIEANHYDQKVALVLNETGETLYESGAIAPGQRIDMIEISRPLENGVHEATAVFTGYDRDTHAAIGSIAVDVELDVA